MPAHIALDDPMVSPAYADLTSLPPLFIQVSSSEQLFDDRYLLLTDSKRLKRCIIENYTADYFIREH